MGLCSNSTAVDSKRPMDQLITIGQIDASDTLGSSLHYAAFNGKKKILKKALDKGINVDYPNDEGQTPLFTASYGGHEKVVDYLLSAGADANEKTNLGYTAIHAACFTGHLKILMKLLQSGGDLRLHDYQGRSAKDWAIMNQNPKKRMKILEFLDKTRMFAISSSGQDLLMNKASSKTLHRAHHRRNTVTNIIRNKIGKPSIHGNLEKMATSQHTLGFGQVYSHGHDSSGFMSAIPFVSENNLKHDAHGETFDNGGFCVMESVWWDYTKVTAKKLRDNIDPYLGGVVDLLINEIEYIGKLRHPNILTLMGVCQALNLDGLYLIYESIPEGSLYNFMHQQLKRLPTEMIQEIALQICDAVIFIHLRGLVHCSITSHAISIINPHLFKLGNFEYMIEVSKCEWGKKNAVASNTEENAVYNWMAPEVMMAMPPSFYCDMYSFCAVLWEMFHGDVPWADGCAESIKSNFSRGKYLKISHGKIMEYFRIILEYGLQQEPTNRKLTFLHVRDLLKAAPKDAKNYMRTRLKHLHYSDDDDNNDPTSGRPDRRDNTINSHHPNQQHKASTSRNVDSALMKGQMRDRDRYANQREMNRHNHQNEKDQENKREQHKPIQNYQVSSDYGNKFECQKKFDNKNKREQVITRDNQNEQHLQKELQKTNLEQKLLDRQYYDDGRSAADYKQRNISGNHRDNLQSTQLTYCANGLKWENFPQEVGEEFIYTVQIKKHESPRKASAPVLDMSNNESNTAKYETSTKYLNFTESETSLENTSQDISGQENTSQTEITTETTTSDSLQFAHGMDLQRKKSSLGNFSYLALGNHQRSKSAGAKPACHGQYELVAEEYSTQGKLTTAGSLYSLYNDHNHDKPLGQIESRMDHEHYSTFPRRTSMFNPHADMESTSDGVCRSVRDLTKLFQQQIAQHNHYQAVLDGTVNREHSSDKIDQLMDKRHTPYKDDNRDFGNHAYTSKHETSCRLDDFKEDSKELPVDNPVTESDSSSTFSSDGSSLSECVSKWVDHELRKIKRNLSKEVVRPKSPSIVQSPDLFTSPDIAKCEVNKPIERNQATRNACTLYFSDSECTDTNEESSDIGQILQSNGDNADTEGFFDDELYHGALNEEHEMKSTIENREKHSVGVKSNLPMTSVMKKIASPSKPKTSVVSTTYPEQSKKKIRRIPRRIQDSRSQLTAKPKSNEGQYANVMTIRSSIDEAGKHHVTHKIKNLKTGGSSTLLNEQVTGQRVKTVFKA